MKAAICYHSYYHGNTLRVLEAMASAGEAELIDVAIHPNAPLEGYGLVGFASGIYGFEIHPSVLEFARRQLPPGKPVFFTYTYGLHPGAGAKALRDLAQERDCPVLGEFSCHGSYAHGPFKLVGGIAKGHPDERDLEAARAFFAKLCQW